MHFGVQNLEAPDEDSFGFRVPCPRRSPDGKEVVGGGETPRCKVCELVEELKASENPADAEAAKQLRAKMQVYTNIIDTTDPVWTEDDVTKKKADGCPEQYLPEIGSPKVQVYNFGPTIFKGLLDAYSDDVDLADLDEGHNVVITREGEGLKTKYRVRAQMKASVATIKDAQLDDSMWNLDSAIPYFSDEQIELILSGASFADVMALNAAPVEEKKQLPKAAGKPKAKAKAKEEEHEEPAAEEESEDPSVLTVERIPVDGDGDILFDQLTDEQIENAANAEITITNNNGDEYGPHVSCFGDTNERKEDDSGCQECGLFERCGTRIEAKEAAAKAAAAKKKGAPGKGKPPAGKAAAKPKAGKGNGTTKAKAKGSTPAPADDPDDLEAQMLAAMGK